MAASKRNPVFTKEAASITIYEHPCDDPDCYPNFDEFMRALQDEGIMSPKKQMQYKELQKCLAPVQETLLAKYLHLGVVKGKYDCRKHLAQACVIFRKTQSTGLVPKELRRFALPGAVTMKIIDHNERGGFDVALRFCIDNYKKNKKASIESRTPNDACRVAAILLLPNHRSAVAKIMSGKKNRAMQDQSVCPFDAFYDVLAAEFRDAALQVKTPENFELIDGHKDINPNDPDRIKLDGRDAAWFKGCWDSYLRPKYRKAIQNWRSETGGGGGAIENFQKFCGNDKWLTYVYMMDVEQSGLLESNASSAVPKELQNETGYEDLDTKPASKKSLIGSSSMKAEVSKAVKAIDEQSNNIGQCMTFIKDLLEQRKSTATDYHHHVATKVAHTEEHYSPTASTTATSKKRSLQDYLDDIDKLSSWEEKVKQDTAYSASTKESMIMKFQARKEKLMKKASECDCDSD